MTWDGFTWYLLVSSLLVDSGKTCDIHYTY